MFLLSIKRVHYVKENKNNKKQQQKTLKLCNFQMLMFNKFDNNIRITIAWSYIPIIFSQQSRYVHLLCEHVPWNFERGRITC